MEKAILNQRDQRVVLIENRINVTKRDLKEGQDTLNLFIKAKDLIDDADPHGDTDVFHNIRKTISTIIQAQDYKRICLDKYKLELELRILKNKNGIQ